MTDLADKMKKLDEDESWRNLVAQTGKQFLNEKCCEPIMAEEIENFFRNFLIT